MGVSAFFPIKSLPFRNYLSCCPIGPLFKCLFEISLGIFFQFRGINDGYMIGQTAVEAANSQEAVNSGFENPKIVVAVNGIQVLPAVQEFFSQKVLCNQVELEFYMNWLVAGKMEDICLALLMFVFASP